EVKDNLLLWHDTGCLLTVVMERHGRNGHVSYGFCTGDCLKAGAAASSLTHDSHNIIVMGENEEDMLMALETIVESHGGIAAVENGKVTGLMALPVAGLMSEGSVEKAGQDFTLLRQAFEKQGYVHRNSVMNFCLLSLTCVPALKLTDCGYMDTENLKMVPLYEELQ
ncbi:MAG: hypothetical protein II126_03685, partial [Erysipelotrichaceae bacterium]|nr:hypothetical protein [Erysipelotrichaceae bacterium]